MRAQGYPLARGHVHITHADDVSALLDFDFRYFESFVVLFFYPTLNHTIVCLPGRRT